MVIYRDNTILDKAFPFAINQYQLNKTDNCRDSFHWHNFCEISYVQSGKGSYYVSGKKYDMEGGDMIIFNHIEPHGWLVESEYMNMTVMIFSVELVSSIKYDYLIPFIERGSNFKNKISKEDFLVSEIIQMMNEIYDENRKEGQGGRLLILADILRILTFLIRYYQKDRKDDNETELLKDKKNDMKRLEEAFRFINAHYMEKISLKQVAEQVFMSENYFSSYFKRAANISFIDYITDLRLRKANELMRTTDMNMYEIALESGFNNMANFYRIYKKHVGELPHRGNVYI